MADININDGPPSPPHSPPLNNDDGPPSTSMSPHSPPLNNDDPMDVKDDIDVIDDMDISGDESINEETQWSPWEEWEEKAFKYHEWIYDLSTKEREKFLQLLLEASGLTARNKPNLNDAYGRASSVG